MRQLTSVLLEDGVGTCVLAPLPIPGASARPSSPGGRLARPGGGGRGVVVVRVGVGGVGGGASFQ